MKRLRHASLVLVAWLLAGCATPEYQPYVGGLVQKGNGGAVTKRDGVDVWSDGTPPRAYRIIGIVEEDGNGYSKRNSVLQDCARSAKEHGGDGVILLSEATGGINLRTGALNRPRVKVAVIKYL